MRAKRINMVKYIKNGIDLGLVAQNEAHYFYNYVPIANPYNPKIVN